MDVGARFRVVIVSFASRLLESGSENRTVEELLGHSDVRATMMNAHVRSQGGLGVRSPADQH